MSITQPTNISPSTLAGSGGGTVAASDNVNISWQVNGNSQLAGVYIELFDAYNNPLEGYYPKVINEEYGLPFFGRDGKGNPNFFTYNPAQTWGDVKIADGGEYRLKITQFWVDKVYVLKINSALSVNTDYYITTHSNVTGINTYVSFTTPENGISQNSALVFDPENRTLGYYTTALFEDGVLSVNNGSAFSPIQCSVSTDPPQSGEILGSSINKTSDGYRFVQQYSVTAFQAKTAPILTISYDTPTTLSGSFSASLTQAQGDYVNWVQWTMTNKSNGDLLYDTGKIFTSELAFDFDGFVSGDIYTVACSVETSSGVIVTAAEDFTVNYAVSPAEQSISAKCNSDNSVTLSWEATEADTVLYKNKDKRLIPYAHLPKDITELKDYGIKSMEQNRYELFCAENGGYITATLEKPFCARFKSYTLIETTPDTENGNVYHVKNVWKFGTNIENSAVSNNNSPNFLQNFTPYRLRQPSPQKGKSGTLSALLGNTFFDKSTEQVKASSLLYKDTAEQMDKLFEISASDSTFFLKDLKGNIYMVHTSEPITQTVNNGTLALETSISIPWEEVGDASDAIIIQLPTDENYDN